MGEKRDIYWLISLVASVIAIVAFVTGRQSIKDFLQPTPSPIFISPTVSLPALPIASPTRDIVPTMTNPVTPTSSSENVQSVFSIDNYNNGRKVIHCEDSLSFESYIDFQVVKMRPNYDYNVRVIGLGRFDPVIAIYESDTLGSAICVDNSEQIQGYAISLPSTGRIYASRTDALISFRLNNNRGLNDVTISIGSLGDLRGEFILLLEGMAVTDFDGFGDPFRVFLPPSLIDQDMPLLVYMMGIENSLDPLVYLHDGDGNVFTLDDGTEIFCNDAGDDRGCWGDAGTADFNMNGFYVDRNQGRTLDADNFDAALLFPVDTFTDVTVDDPLIFDLAMTGAGGTLGEYMVIFQAGTQ